MAVQQFTEFKLPTVNTDIRGNLKQLNGRVWYNNIENRFKYKKNGQDVTVADLEELKSEKGASLIGLPVNRFGKNLDEVILNFGKLLEQSKSNIKWYKEVKYNVNYIKMGTEDINEVDFSSCRDGERILDLSTKKHHVIKEGKLSKTRYVKEEDSFIFKSNGSGRPLCKDIQYLANNKIYRTNGLVEMDLLEGMTLTVVEEGKSYTYSLTVWVQSMNIGNHDTLPGVKGGHYHVTKDEKDTIKSLTEERLTSNLVKSKIIGPIPFTNPMVIKHDLGTKHIIPSIFTDLNGEPSSYINSFGITILDEDRIQVTNVSGKCWITLLGLCSS